MRIASVNIPDNKRIVIALTYIFGIGLSTSKKILDALKIDHSIRAKDLPAEDAKKIQEYLTENHIIEGDLRRQINGNISRLITISCYRGIRHREGLSVRGQKTRNKGGKRRERRKKRASNL